MFVSWFENGPKSFWVSVEYLADVIKELGTAFTDEMFHFGAQFLELLGQRICWRRFQITSYSFLLPGGVEYFTIDPRPVIDILYCLCRNIFTNSIKEQLLPIQPTILDVHC